MDPVDVLNTDQQFIWALRIAAAAVVSDSKQEAYERNRAAAGK